MSKMVSKFALTASVVLAMVLTLFCPEAQATDNEKRIIGTWAQVETDGSDGEKWVFNSDGTATIRGNTTRYAVVAGKLAFVYVDVYIKRTSTSVCELSFSTDGKTAILAGSIECSNALLRKKN